MKKGITLILICVFIYVENISAQISFNKVGSAITIEGDSSKKYDKVEFRFSSAFKGSEVGIYTSDGSNPTDFVDRKFGKGSNDIQADLSGEYRITIQSNHKVEGCENCNEQIPNHFKIRIDDKLFGPFHLNKTNNLNSEQANEALFKNVISPGYLFYDALYISDNWKKQNNIDTILFILKHYDIVDTASLNRNLFLKNILNGLFNGIEGGGGSLSVANIVSSIGGFNITNTADGFAKFIVKRTKQELNIAFFERFKQEIDSIKDLQTLFPQTYRTLSVIGDDIYMFEAYVQTLRESFEKDLSSLPSNLPTIIENHQAYFDKVPELKGGLLTAFYLAEAIQNKEHPGEIIENYDESIWDSIQNVKAVFQTLKLFSTSLRSNGDSVYWVSYSEMKKLTTDETLLNIYLGLVLQKARKEGIKFEIKGEDKFLADLMNEGYITLQPYKAYINNLAPKIQSIENRIKKMRDVQSDSLLFENYYSLVSSSVDLMRYASQIDKLPILVKYNLKLEEKTKLYFEMAQTGADIAVDVNRRNYSSAIVNVVHLYDQAIAKWDISRSEYKMAVGKIKEATGIDVSVLTKSYSEILKEIINKLSDDQLKILRPYFDKLRYFELYKTNINKDAIDKILRYGSFMATVAQAKSPDDVEAAIEAVALPTGSARIKRETMFNVALNAYSGFYIGHEDVKFSLQNGRFLNSYGITAPIGITINWGSNRFLGMPAHREGHFSHSVFFTAVDIGAIASFRFVDDTTKTLSKIELRDIISPGIFYSMGIPKTPLSVNLGYQITPYLRGVSSSSSNFKSSFSRFSISLCVDIPLLNFYTKSK
jgi:hypothetical protein